MNGYCLDANDAINMGIKSNFEIPMSKEDYCRGGAKKKMKVDSKTYLGAFSKDGEAVLLEKGKIMEEAHDFDMPKTKLIVRDLTEGKGVPT